ncbi:hypothetical protein KFE25_006550 [Diacronema lutheri]|uniref:Probable transcriptional regulator ycf27 n=1 Tax=Diacronema lutheri TaxID=2081491 RepID=A0A8J6C6G8_DIALT|nr:hypothetical protein KFE25_006550 [Diacronema lutheri]
MAGLAAAAGLVLYAWLGVFAPVQPASAAVARAPRVHRARTLAAAPAAPPSVLVVDDDESLRSAIARYLRASGFAVREAASGDEGLALARGERPQLIVLDVMMPGLSGIDTLEQLRADAALATTPVILLTARGFTADRIRGHEAGCSAYVTKPFDPDELVAIARALLEADRRYAARRDAAQPQPPAAPPSPAEASALALAPRDETRPAASAAAGALADAPPLPTLALSSRELEVLRLVSRGLMNKEIARELEISSRMVEKYVSRLLGKTRTFTRTELARLAVERGLAQ